MPRFLLKATLFIVSAVVLYYLAYQALFAARYYKWTANDPHAIYVIGDSRVVHGLNVEMLAQRTGRRVYDFSYHGASVYGMYVLAEHVPAHATVLLAPSLGMFFRQRDRVSYEIGLSASGLWRMWQLGYDWWFFKKILSASRYPFVAGHRTENTQAYPVTDGPDLVKKKRFVKAFQATGKPVHYAKNRELFKAALDGLLAKGCQVKLVQYPVTPELAEMRARSVYGPMIEELDFLKTPRPGLQLYLDIPRPQRPGTNVWWDMDHLNVVGRDLITAWIAAHVFADLPGSNGARPAAPAPGRPSTD